jgi:hypothetical protein
MINLTGRFHALQHLAFVIHGGDTQIGATQVHSNGKCIHDAPPGAKGQPGRMGGPVPAIIIANRFNKTTETAPESVEARFIERFYEKMREWQRETQIDFSRIPINNRMACETA